VKGYITETNKEELQENYLVPGAKQRSCLILLNQYDL